MNFADMTKEELIERNLLLTSIALSALCLKLNIEHGFEPHLNALNRDLAAFHRRFGGFIDEPSESKAGTPPVA